MTELADPLSLRVDTDVVLCGGTYKYGDMYLATTFQHEDEFGMLGGEMRVLAAVARAQRGLCRNILFAGGKSIKGAAMRGGEHVPAPPSAAAYAAQFANMLEAAESLAEESDDSVVPEPTIILDTKTPNTNANMAHSVQLAFNNSWETMAIISNEYHLPRVRALYKIIKEKLGHSVEVNFLAAEAVVRLAYPGVYDEEIERAYASPAGQRRLKSESQGLADIQAGIYKFKEVTREALDSRTDG